MAVMLICLRCQKRNREGVIRCEYCGASMAGAVRLGGEPAGRRSGPASGGPTSGFATASLVLGLLGLFTFGAGALAGLITGIAGLRQIQRSGGHVQGQGLAVAGIVVSALVMMVMLVFVPIVAAILFPVFAQAREKARTAVCMDRMRHLGVAMAMYAQDYDDHEPLRRDWCDGLLPYARGREGTAPALLFQCPSLPEQQGAQAYNAFLSGVSQNRLTSPYSTIVLFDSRGGWNLSGGPDLAAPRHNNGWDTLFADGHVHWLNSFNYSSLVWKPRAPAPAPHHRRGRHRHRR
jgi:hypothetical protein